MSIATKKFQIMLEQEIESDKDLTVDQRNALKKLCYKIYILETTNDSSIMPTQIKEEIKFFANEYEK